MGINYTTIDAVKMAAAMLLLTLASVAQASSKEGDNAGPFGSLSWFGRY